MLGSYTQVFTVYNDWRKFSVFLIWKIHDSSQQLTRTFAQLLAIPWRRNISRNLTTKKIGMKLLTCPFPDGILPITSSNEWTNRKRIVNPNPAYAGSCYHDYKATNTSAHVGANHLSIILKINKDAFKFFLFPKSICEF